LVGGRRQVVFAVIGGDEWIFAAAAAAVLNIRASGHPGISSRRFFVLRLLCKRERL